MAHGYVPKLTLVAAMALVGLGTLAGVALGQTNSPFAETPDMSIAEISLSSVASPTAATPVSGLEGIDAIVRDAEGNAIGYATLTETPDDNGMVNVYVEVNTFVGLGTLTTGAHGIHVDACKTAGVEP